MSAVRRRGVVVLVFLLQTGACTTWQPANASPARVFQEQTPTRIRITRTDGERITMRNPRIRSDSIIGTREFAPSASGGPPARFGNAIAVALADILQLEVSETVDMPGQMVRVQLTDDRLTEGVVQQWTPGSLGLSQADGSVSLFGWADVREVLLYRTRGHAGVGLLVGALLGGAVAGTHAGVTWEPCTFLCIGPGTRGGTIALASLLGGVAGGALGALFGTVIRSPSWEPVAIPVVSPNSAALRLGMRWSGSR